MNREYRDRSATFLKSLILLFVVAAVLPYTPYHFPSTLIVGSQIVIPVVFALVHGTQTYGLRGILAFVASCLVIGNVIENIGVASGLPFGRYYFSDVMGPKLFLVPISMGFAYVALGYSCWTMTTIILNRGAIDRKPANALLAPATAALMMVAWDLAMDPIWSNVGHFWRWYQGGTYFGVPLHNFFGWFITNYLIFQMFEIYLRRERTTRSSLGNAQRTLPLGHWRLAILAFALVAATNFLAAGSLLKPGLVSDGAGIQWPSSSMGLASASISVFLMGGVASLAWMRLRYNQSSPRQGTLQSVAGHGSAR